MVDNIALINGRYYHSIIIMLCSKGSSHVIAPQELVIRPYYFCIYMDREALNTKQ